MRGTRVRCQPRSRLAAARSVETTSHAQALLDAEAEALIERDDLGVRRANLDVHLRAPQGAQPGFGGAHQSCRDPAPTRLGCHRGYTPQRAARTRYPAAIHELDAVTRQ